jgi:hypothetical protein
MTRCQHCESSDVRYIKVKGWWRCTDCDETFDGPPPEGVSSRPQRIFLSYGHDENSTLVDALRARLEAAGHHVWIDHAEIKAGDDWRAAITAGICNSDRVLSFLSKHSTRDPGVCLDEIGIALAHRHGAIATLLVEPVDLVAPPPSIAHIQYLNLSSWREEHDKGEAPWNIWLDAQTSEILNIIARNIGFAGDMDELQKLLIPLPQGGRVGMIVERGFVGREWLLDAIEAWRANSTVRTWLVTAGPGMGKSAVAARLAHFARSHTVAYHFCRFDEPATRGPVEFICNLSFQLAARLPGYRTLLIRAVRYAGKPVDQFQQDELFTRLLADPLRYAIDGGQRDDRLLAIIDALDEAPEIAELLAKRKDELPAWLALLITSRPDANVLAAFSGISPQVIVADDPRNCRDLETFIDGWFVHLEKPLPDAAKRTLLERSEGSIYYLATAKAGVTQGVFDLASPTEYPKGLGGLYRQWFQRQFGNTPSGKLSWDGSYPLLEVLCASIEPLPVSIARQCLDWKGQDRVNASRPLGSLISEGDGCLEFFHRSIAEWLQDVKLAERFWVNVEDGRIRLAASLWATIPSLIARTKPDYAHRVLPNLLLAIPTERRTELWGSDSSHLQLIEKLKDAMEPFQDLSSRMAKMALARVRVEECWNTFGEEETTTLRATLDLASQLAEVGADYRSAQALQLRVMEIATRKLGEESPDTMKAMEDLASTCHVLGENLQAKTLQEKVLDLRSRSLGERHQDTLWAMNHLANTIKDLGEKSRAKQLHESVLAARRELLGEEHFDTLRSMTNVAHALSDEGDLAGARALQEQVLAVRQRLLGNDHERTLIAMINLANTVGEQGDHLSARTLLEKSLEGGRRIWGDDHPKTATIKHNLSSCLVALDEFSPAKSLAEQAIVVRRRVLGHDHPDTLDSMGSLAATCWKIEDYEATRQLDSEILDIKRKKLGDEHEEVLAAKAALSEALRACGDLDAAKSLGGDVLAVRRRLQGDDHPDTLEAMGSLAGTCWKMEDYDATRQLESEILDIKRTKLGNEHEETLSAMDDLAATLSRMNFDDESTLLRSESLAIRRCRVERDNPERLISLDRLVAVIREWAIAGGDNNPQFSSSYGDDFVVASYHFTIETDGSEYSCYVDARADPPSLGVFVYGGVEVPEEKTESVSELLEQSNAELEPCKLEMIGHDNQLRAVAWIELDGAHASEDLIDDLLAKVSASMEAARPLVMGIVGQKSS